MMKSSCPKYPLSVTNTCSRKVPIPTTSAAATSGEILWARRDPRCRGAVTFWSTDTALPSRRSLHRGACEAVTHRRRSETYERTGWIVGAGGRSRGMGPASGRGATGPTRCCPARPTPCDALWRAGAGIALRDKQTPADGSAAGLGLAGGGLAEELGQGRVEDVADLRWVWGGERLAAG